MSTAFEAPQLSVADIVAGLKTLFARLIADPNLLPKIKTLWESITAFWNLPPQQNPDNDAIVRGWLAELPPRGGEPQKFGDGRIIAFIAAVKDWIDTHPQLVALFLQILAWLPKETA